MTSAERYRLVRTVATGGMAQVVEAVAHGMDGFERRVAIKRLLPQYARDGEHRRMFLEEARITSRLHHGGIVAIFDYGIIDGSAFLAMEFVDGLDALRALSMSGNGTPMPEGIALHLVAEIGHALAYIHALRDDQDRPLEIVHRDVSPQNILLSWDGDIRLSDFGIASSYRRQDLTTAGAIKGKLRFMAPEQGRGERVTPAADVYALGATLDALLGGKATTPAMTDAESARRVQEARFRNVSPAACVVIGACLARDPDRRPGAGAIAARAGALASRRLGRDGRAALRAWLRPLRESAKRQTALDDLMGQCLVPVGPAAARTYTVTQASKRHVLEPGARAAASSGEISVVSSAVRSVVRSPERSAARPAERSFPRRPRKVVLIGATLGALLIGGETRLSIPPAAAPSASIVASAPVPTRGRAGQPRASAAGSREVAARPRPAPVARVRSEAASSPTAAEDHQLAWLRVGGPTLAGARVSVDGTTAGFAPLELPRPLGAHSIKVTAATSGRTLLRRTVRLGDEHTRTAPLRIVH